MLALVVLACIPPSILSFATVSRLRAQISWVQRGRLPVIMVRRSPGSC
uniref:Uncharacterized protein n=1 Tax=Arundo donax TaxID=35708 RepID=A0A0A9D8K5_ARUDO